MLEEILPIIVQVLVAGKPKSTIEEICDFSGYDKHDIAKGIKVLEGISILRSEVNKYNKTEYYLIKEVKPIHLAKAAQVGLDLASFNDFFNISEKERAIALELTSKADNIRNWDISKRKPMIQKRNYFMVDKLDDVGNNLLLFFEATNLALYEHIESLAKEDPKLQLLLMLNEEAESSLKTYLDSIK